MPCSSSPSRLTLAIETSNPSADQTAAASSGTHPTGPSVALGWTGSESPPTLLGIEALRSTSRHDDDLFCAIDRLWQRVHAENPSLKKSAIDRIAVSAGPGGYTGLRVAVAAAKTLALALDARCVQVPSAMIVAANLDPTLPTPLGIAMASKADRTILTTFETLSIPAMTRSPLNSCEITVDDLADDQLRTLVADAHLPAPIAQWCADHHIPIHAPTYDALACLRLSCFLPDCDPHALEPIYGRQPEAVRQWRQRHRPKT